MSKKTSRELYVDQISTFLTPIKLNNDIQKPKNLDLLIIIRVRRSRLRAIIILKISAEKSA